MLPPACSTALIVSSLTAALSTAPDPRLAITDIEQVDQDFAYQGEYLGAVPREVFDCEYLGLQVVALGQRQFEAVLLWGGLPGAGWDRATKTGFEGRRRRRGVRFRNRQYRLRVTPAEAVIRGRDGSEIARLPKIHRVSVAQDAPPPAGAIVLFDGTSTDNLDGGRMNQDGLLEVGVLTKMPVGDFRMHLEFRTPYMPHARGQGRGNSGIYIQQRYEVQILDSFGLDGAANECGGLYKQRRPDVNMCLPPLSWQTYDIYFTAARYDARGNKVRRARITVLHNGEPIHSDYELLAKTGGGRQEGPQWRPILLQNHRNPVHFRNIWMVMTGGPAVPATPSWSSVAEACWFSDPVWMSEDCWYICP